MVDFREICSRGPSKISIIILLGIVSSKDRDVLSKREVLRLVLYSLSFCGSLISGAWYFKAYRISFGGLFGFCGFESWNEERLRLVGLIAIDDM